MGPVRAARAAAPTARPVIGDRGYDHDSYRRALWRRGVKPTIARRGTRARLGLGRWPWVVERSFAWLHNFRRLRIRREHDPNLHIAFLTLACAAICWRFLATDVNRRFSAAAAVQPR
jgi:transposase